MSYYVDHEANVVRMTRAAWEADIPEYRGGTPEAPTRIALSRDGATCLYPVEFLDTAAEEALGYEMSPRTRFFVHVRTEDGPRTFSGCWTLREARDCYVLERDANVTRTGRGASAFGSGEVYDEQGQHVARISYNGRVWPPQVRTRDMKPVLIPETAKP